MELNSEEIVRAVVKGVVKNFLKKQLESDALQNAQGGIPKLNLKKMLKSKYDKEYEKYRRYKKYKRKYKELKDIGLEWGKCQDAEKKRKEEEETRRNYISGNSVNREEIKKKLSSHQSSLDHQKVHRDKDKTDIKKTTENKDKDIKEKIKKDKDKMHHRKEKERTNEKVSKEHSKDSNLEKDRNKKVESKSEIKREKELPLVTGKPYSTSFKQLIKKDSNKSEKRPMEKYVNKNLSGEKKSSKEKRTKVLDPVDVMKQMREASKIGEKSSGPSFKIPKKAVSSSVLSETEISLDSKLLKSGSYQRIKHDKSTPEREISPPLSPSSSVSDEWSPEKGKYQRLSSSPDIYKDISPLQLPNSPPASPDLVKEEKENNLISENEEEIWFNLSEDIKPMVNGLNKDHQPLLIDSEADMKDGIDIILDIEDNAGTVNEKFFCQLCDLFDKEGGKKSLVALHILQNHFKGISDELETCKSVKEKMKMFFDDEIFVTKQMNDYGVNISLYQPGLTLDDNISRWKCLRCPNVSTMYKNELEAERHVALEHYGDMLVPRKWFIKGCQVFKCSQMGCEKEFNSWMCLTNHEILQHDAFKGYLGKVFKNDYLLKTNIPKKRLRD